MRSWGTPAMIHSPEVEVVRRKENGRGVVVEQANDGMEEKVTKKNKKRIGDERGPRKKASSKRPRSEVDGEEATIQIASASGTSSSSQTKSKKRKPESYPHPILADGNSIPANGNPNPVNFDSKPTIGGTPLPDKLSKRLWKNMSKLEKGFGETTLEQWLDTMCAVKGKLLNATDVMRGVMVSFTDDRWVLRVA